jgi:hypothetical protein
MERLQISYHFNPRIPIHEFLYEIKRSSMIWIYWSRSFRIFVNRELMMQGLQISCRFNPRILIWKFMYEINDCEPPLIRWSGSLLRLHLSNLFSPNFLASWLDLMAHGISTLLPGSAPPSDSTLVNLFRDSGLSVTKNLACTPSSRSLNSRNDPTVQTNHDQ